jgi:hypothetical protein
MRMIRRMSDIVSAGSLKNLEVRLSMSIDAALQALADLDRLRTKAGLGPVEPKPFYLGAEHRVALAEALAEAKPEKPLEGWRAVKAQQEAAKARGPQTAEPRDGAMNPMTCLRTIKAMVRHPGLTTEDWPSIILMMASLAGCDDTEPTEAQTKSITTICDGYARNIAGAVGPKHRVKELARHQAWWKATQDDDQDNGLDENGEPIEDEDEDGEPKEDNPPPRQPPRKVFAPFAPTSGKVPQKSEPAVVVATAEQILRAGAIRRGEVTELPPPGSLARKIIEAGATRRNEKLEDPK